MSHYKPYPAYKDSGVEWLGQVPEHWTIGPYKATIQIENGSDYKEVESDDGYPVIGSGGPFAYSSKRMYDGESVLLGRKGTIDKPLYVNGAFWAVDTMYWSIIKPGAHGRFAYYIATTIPFDMYSTNTALPSMTKSVLGSHLVAFPGFEEQQVIANHLDRETARIDALVAKKTRFIELLREKRQALITHAVTKGLDPNVTMKDSGVEWLGEVPEHWDVLSFQRCVFIAEGQVDPEKSPYREMILLAPNHIESGSGLLLHTETAEEQSAESGKYLCEKGDVVYSKIRPALRKVCMAPEVSLCSADMYPMRGHSGMSNQFLFWFLLSEPFSAFAVLEADRVAMPKINRESLNSVQLPRPPFSEQLEIVARLSQATTRLDNLRVRTERSVELLKERRSALITAAVTGQIDLRETA